MGTGDVNLKAIGANLKKATAEMVVLSMIAAKEETYGFEITRTMASLSENEYCIGEGSTYTILTRLEEAGCITSAKRAVAGKRVRVYYQITEQGKKQLNAFKDEYRHQVELIQKLIDYNDKTGL